ncbi:hypothetical protein ECMP0209802_2271 [Escherichia coli MP020980.2]|nr:hypothetical protein ECAI27_29010 [Escherichia coli AI27]EMW50837.1 hypothetical protein EC2780750_1318 [Escherichia coli 2780750]EMX49644.1 hypothetical protein ECMP0209802_2271 [Escherichia coli MP020980.2]END54034.1 hypothetical protein ECMP0209801_1532 [Escherichia coli MP020980.1]KDW53623.1 hypothetical protein AB82_4627 [Escherichia coli 2-005-03_S3_C1]KDW63882.1 hypothetical protein AC40_4728 [Escherichia coli 2-005-03_S3_C3]DAP13142.1 MAG TPA: hypothetical protein [Caudoviricetes s
MGVLCLTLEAFLQPAAERVFLSAQQVRALNPQTSRNW